MDQYEKVNASVIGVEEVDSENIHRYGVIDPVRLDSEFDKG